MGIFNFGPSKKELRKQILELQNKNAIIEKNLENIKNENNNLKESLMKYLNLKEELEVLFKNSQQLNTDITSKSEELKRISTDCEVKLQEYTTLKDEYNIQLNKLENIPKKKIKINTIFKSMENTLKEYISADLPSHYLNLPDYDHELIDRLTPSISIKLHSMDIKKIFKNKSRVNRGSTK